VKLNVPENYTPREEAKGGSDRSFGLIVGGMLAAIGLYRWPFGEAAELEWLTLLFLVTGPVLVVAGLVAPATLASLNRAWTKLGALLSKVVNPMVTFVIFAVAIVPIGLAMRLAGHDPMRLKHDPETRSYWIERRPPGPDPETMRDMF
jgi:hypothetical protein